MTSSVTVNGTPYQYEAEADAGVNLQSGERWFGTLVRWRPGTSGRWNRFHVIDLHPFDFECVEQAIIEYVKGRS